MLSPSGSINSAVKSLFGGIGCYEISPFGTYILSVVDGTELSRKYVQVLPQAKRVMKGTFFEEMKKRDKKNHLVTQTDLQ